MTAYITPQDLAFLLRWIVDHAGAVPAGLTPAVVSEAHPIKRLTARIRMLGVGKD